MKTNSLHQIRYSSYSALIILSVFVASCRSYQNASYFDSDGIYGDGAPQQNVAAVSDNQNNSYQYKNYFESLQDPSAKKDSTFTDVERYNSNTDNNEQRNNSNSIWGGDSGTTVVNIYDNSWGWNNWGWNMGWGNYWGWNMGWNIGWGWDPWIGPGWGWGWNNWYGPGWGWNNWYGPGWGWNNWNGPGWGWGNHYNPYRYGTRSFAGNNRGYTSAGLRETNGRRYDNRGVRNASDNFGTRRNDAIIRNTRTDNNFNNPRVPTRNNSNTNQNNSTPRYNSSSSTRSQWNGSRNSNNSTRHNSSNYGGNGGGRSSGGSYGGGRSSGGSYGGGRSSGGGRR